MEPVRLALLTPRGRAAIAVVACDGAARRALVRSCVRWRNAIPDLAELATPRLCRIELDGEELDRALVVDLPAEERLELHLHGSEAILAALETRFGPFVAPVPSAAERLLRDALCATQLELALEQLARPFATFLAELAGADPEHAREAALAALQRSRAARAQVEAARVVLVGAQNAGKSTLFNRLLMEERALTGPEPGLTRDAVREVTTLAGYPYQIVDAAGVGVAVDALDRRAQEAGERERHAAFVVVVVDGTRGPTPCDAALGGPEALWIRTKADLEQAVWTTSPGVPAAPHLTLSARAPDAAPLVREQVGEALRRLRTLPPAGRVGGPAALDAGEAARLAEFVAERPAR